MFELTNRDYAHFYFEDFDLDAQLIAIRGALASARSATKQQTGEIERLAARAKEIGSDHLVGMWTDEVHSSVYHDAARSAAAVGMLAPFVENLFVGIYRGIGKMGVDVLGHDPASERSVRAVTRFWDPHYVYATREIRDDLVGGILQLAEASGLAPHLPADLKAVLEALFGYRNKILHNGFEWPVAERESFANRIKSWPAGWFESATSNGQPWVWYMSDAFTARVVALIDEVLEAAGQHARLHYAPKTGDKPA
jgi:hypothetical protein